MSATILPFFTLEVTEQFYNIKMLSQLMILKYQFFGCVWRQFIEIIELSWNDLISVDDRKTHFI